MLQDAASVASRGVAGIPGSAEMEMAVARLERLQGDMRRHLEAAFEVIAARAEVTAFTL